MTEKEWQACLDIINNQLDEMTKVFDELHEALVYAEASVEDMNEEIAWRDNEIDRLEDELWEVTEGAG